MAQALTELIAGAPWREAATYRETWPHDYVLTDRDNQRDLLASVCERFCAEEEVPSRFFRLENKHLFIGNYKYRLMTGYNEIDPYNDEGDYVLNRAPLYRDRRDFVVQPGDSGMAENYPSSPTWRW